MTDPITETRRRALQALRPPPRLSLAPWIESELRLPDTVSATPGRVRLWPYQRGIAEAISDPEIERVTLVKSVRVGLSTLLTATVANYVANEPSPILLLLPTEADARDYMVSDLEPIFDASPAVSGLLTGESDEAGRNTLLSRRFPGGSLKIVAAKSPRNLRRHNVRILLVDEADAMDRTAEGNPLVLAERRTLSFSNRKIVIGSTPTIEETSNVLRAYAASDQRVFEVPCPECGAFTEIRWAHIEWEPDKPETAAFRCPHCETLIEERYKAAMADAGAWRITRPEVQGHAGFRVNALISTLANASWAKLAAEFLAAKEHPDQLQTFVNTILGEGWRESAEDVDPNDLQARAEDFGLDSIPPEVLLVTAGVDVQGDRLECSLVGHGRDAAFILGHAVIWGSPGDDSAWAELDEMLRTRWTHPNGGTLRIDAALIDSGDGTWTEKVYAFTRARFGRKILAGKGVAGVRPPLQRSSVKGAPMFLVGVDGLKSQVLQRIARGNSLRFSDRLEAEYFSQVASERRVLRYFKGQPVRRFERIPGRRAEALDCLVYALASRHALNPNFDAREVEMATVAATKNASSPIIKSRWLGS